MFKSSYVHNLIPLLVAFFCTQGVLAADLNCEDHLKTSQVEQEGPLARQFFSSPELIFTDGGSHPDAFPFYASNEFDWFNTPWDTSATDVVVGFGTNSAWDIASRKKTKLLVIGDYVAGPLIAQRYILRPLLRLAKTPVEFLLMLTGLPVPEIMADLALHNLDRYMDLVGSRLTNEQFKVGMRATIERLGEAGASNEEMQAIAEYYAAVLFGSMQDQFGVVRSHGAHRTGNVGSFFNARYFELNLIRAGAAVELVKQPEFSFLSSQAAFERFRSLYATSLYAHTDYRSPDFYRQLKALGDARGYTKYTFSLSNILDVAASSKAEAVASLQAFRVMIEALFPAPKYEVILFLTTNSRPPHGFIRLTRGEEPPLEKWLFPQR